MYWLLAHMIGDYLLQNDWMANNKKTSYWACLVHAATYMLPFAPMLCSGFSERHWQNEFYETADGLLVNHPVR